MNCRKGKVDEFPRQQNFNTGHDHGIIKKYVIGTPDDKTGGGAEDGLPYENTYLCGWREVDLIYAEAI